MTDSALSLNQLDRVFRSQGWFRRAWYQLGRSVVRAAGRLLFDMDVVYHAPVPQGAKILAANHPSTTDPFIITTLVREHMSTLITEVLFRVPVVGASLRASGQIRVDFDNGKPALQQGIDCLHQGRTVGIFPEGAISPANGFARAHSGAARLALSSGAVVVPVGIFIERQHLVRTVTRVNGKPEPAFWYLRGAYVITVGRPVAFHGSPDDREAVRQVTEQIMAQIGELTRQSQERYQARRWVRPSLAWLPAFFRRSGFAL